MYFTNDDYKRIQQWLQHNSIKDTDLPGAEQIDGTETVVIVQNGQNMKVSLSEFADQLLLVGIPDFVNVTDRFGAHSLEEAIEAIPFRSRKVGQVVTFMDMDNKWRRYQFQGIILNQWNTNSLWIELK